MMEFNDRRPSSPQRELIQAELARQAHAKKYKVDLSSVHFLDPEQLGLEQPKMVQDRFTHVAVTANKNDMAMPHIAVWGTHQDNKHPPLYLSGSNGITGKTDNMARNPFEDGNGNG